MFKNIYVALILSILLSSSLVFGQEGGAKYKLRDEIVDALSQQDEMYIIQAIEGGSADVKSIAFEALIKKGGNSDKVINVVGVYVVYYMSISVQDTFAANVRANAIKAAANIKSERLIDPLSEILYEDIYIPNIVGAAYALGEIGNTRATEALIHQLRLSENQAIIYEVVNALGKIGDPAALSDLLKVSQDYRFGAEVRKSATEAIKKLKTKTAAAN